MRRRCARSKCTIRRPTGHCTYRSAHSIWYDFDSVHEYAVPLQVSIKWLYNTLLGSDINAAAKALLVAEALSDMVVDDHIPVIDAFLSVAELVTSLGEF